jgi:hypothetical protein
MGGQRDQASGTDMGDRAELKNDGVADRTEDRPRALACRSSVEDAGGWAACTRRRKRMSWRVKKRA